MHLDIAFMLSILPAMARACLVTVEVSLATLALTLPVSLAGACAALLGPAWLRVAVRGMVVFTRGVPPLVQISAVYFLPPRIGLLIDEFWTGVIALAMIGSGYGIEIIRGAITSLPSGQREIGLALGLSEWQTLRLVLAPQAWKAMLPPLANEIANLVKASALLSVISVNELTKVGNDLIFENFVVVEVLIEVAFFYLVIIGALMFFAKRLEMRAH